MVRIRKNKIKKKGQFKIQQMAFMLIALTLFFVMFGLLVLTIKTAGLKEKFTEIEEENAQKLVSKLANAPEFSCSGAFSYLRSNCIDSDKIMMLKDRLKYKEFWKVADIEIRKLYPEYPDIECTFKNYPNCTILKVYHRDVKNQGPYKSNFVSLCRKDTFEREVYDKCELARLMVSYEVKNE